MIAQQFFSAAQRLNFIIVSTITSISSIFLPRLTYCFKKNLNSEANKTIDIWKKYISIFAYPFAAGSFVLSGEIIRILAGKEYIASMYASQILSLKIVLSGFSNIIGVILLSNNLYFFPYVIEGLVRKLLGKNLRSIDLNVFKVKAIFLKKDDCDSEVLTIAIAFFCAKKLTAQSSQL